MGTNNHQEIQDYSWFNRPFIHKYGIVDPEYGWHSWLNYKSHPCRRTKSLVLHIGVEKPLYFIVDNIIRRYCGTENLPSRLLQAPFFFLFGINCGFPFMDVVAYVYHWIKGTLWDQMHFIEKEWGDK